VLALSACKGRLGRITERGAARALANLSTQLLRSSLLEQGWRHTSASRPRRMEHRGGRTPQAALSRDCPETGASGEGLSFGPTLRSGPACANLDTQLLRSTSQAHPQSRASLFPGSARALSLRAEAERPRRGATSVRAGWNARAGWPGWRTQAQSEAKDRRKGPRQKRRFLGSPVIGLLRTSALLVAPCAEAERPRCGAMAARAGWSARAGCAGCEGKCCGPRTR
jgi:hypothetical protein